MTAPSLREAVAQALARTRLGHAKPAVLLYEAADAAIAVALPIIREHYAGVADRLADDQTRRALGANAMIVASQIAAAIRADEGPK